MFKISNTASGVIVRTPYDRIVSYATFRWSIKKEPLSFSKLSRKVLVPFVFEIAYLYYLKNPFIFLTIFSKLG